MSITRAQLAKQMQPGLNAIFADAYNRYENQHKDIFDTFTSEKAYEEDVGEMGFGAAPVKAEGAATAFQNTMRETYVARYVHETVSLGFAITEEALEDNLYERDASKAARKLGMSMGHTKQVKAADVYNRAFSGSYLGGDGVSLCSTAHPLFGGGTFANRPNSGVDLSEAALEDALVAISLFVDDQGIPVSLTGVSLHIPPQLVFVAERLLQSQLRPSAAASTFAPNDINAIKNKGMLPKGYFVNHRFTDVNAWFIRTDCPDGMKHFERVGLQTKSYVDDDTGNIKYRSRERYSFGRSDPRAVYGSPGST